MMRNLIVALIAAVTLAGCVVVPWDWGHHHGGYRRGGYYGGHYDHYRGDGYRR